MHVILCSIFWYKFLTSVNLGVSYILLFYLSDIWHVRHNASCFLLLLIGFEIIFRTNLALQTLFTWQHPKQIKYSSSNCQLATDLVPVGVD
ncbi:hypothetical protein BY996DRAFT_7006650 [Phakopsora pachyrhizi]|nr:hypothetical protein BY996DRAFT_7006650 [Phakopsora pachyrhizi]